jgi:uncharacterized membrane protein
MAVQGQQRLSHECDQRVRCTSSNPHQLGPVFKLDPTSRRRWLFGLGALTSAGFIVLRATNLYGDPAPWTAHDGWLATLLSFIDCEKYPP